MLMKSRFEVLTLCMGILSQKEKKPEHDFAIQCLKWVLGYQSEIPQDIYDATKEVARELKGKGTLNDMMKNINLLD